MGGVLSRPVNNFSITKILGNFPKLKVLCPIGKLDSRGLRLFALRAYTEDTVLANHSQDAEDCCCVWGLRDVQRTLDHLWISAVLVDQLSCILFIFETKHRQNMVTAQCSRHRKPEHSCDVEICDSCLAHACRQVIPWPYAVHQRIAPLMHPSHTKTLDTFTANWTSTTGSVWSSLTLHALAAAQWICEYSVRIYKAFIKIKNVLCWRVHRYQTKIPTAWLTNKPLSTGLVRHVPSLKPPHNLCLDLHICSLPTCGCRWGAQGMNARWHTAVMQRVLLLPAQGRPKDC